MKSDSIDFRKPSLVRSVPSLFERDITFKTKRLSRRPKNAIFISFLSTDFYGSYWLYKSDKSNAIYIMFQKKEPNIFLSWYRVINK